MSLSVDDFKAFHLAVHEKSSFDWQIRLLRQVVEERAWPRVLDLPTGSGKTTCIDIGLFALALDALNEPAKRWCPRRIAMVVDRRIVVDQVAERGRRLLGALVSPNAPPVVGEVARRLQLLSTQAEDPVAVFTLRGGMPKDDGWARTPHQPLILASTVDQLGSRLLIQGYGVSKGMRPVHAGLLSNDVLLLLDEVHLSQPFAETLDALHALRDKFRDRSLAPARFHYALLSATPGQTEVKPFRLNDTDVSPDSALFTRLHAKKRARLREETDRPSVEKACVDEARKMIGRHDVVAVVVNRVASATTIARQLREQLSGEVDLALLTGRMRPLDRDDVLRPLRPRIVTGRDRENVARKLVVVGTQCIEAGADFDFDALVTEAASLDALRQRFGRVDRLGLYEEAEGVIVHDKSNKVDPVYGETIAETVKWLKRGLTKRDKDIDFGVIALRQPSESELQELVSPKRHAPVLLPAYLDLWMQTSPKPVRVPDISLWLHGPSSGPADVQVVWRVDLEDHHLQTALESKEGRERAIAIVAAVRPSSLEAMSLPFGATQRWLSGHDVGDIADVEGPEGAADSSASNDLVMRWSGLESEVIPARSIRPGDTIVVPATRGGIRDGCFDPNATEKVWDLAERAALFGRGQPVLRLHPKVLEQWGLSVPTDDLEEALHALKRVAEQYESSDWRRYWLDALSRSRDFVVYGDSLWTVLQAKRIRPESLRALMHVDDTIEDGLELTTDGDDSCHSGQTVTLSEHSSNVERLARRYGTEVGLPPEVVSDLALAAWLHDIGKADRRFQVLLRGGSKIDFFKDETPWAKSGMLPGAKAAHRLAQARSGYPTGARHEVQSLAMIEANIAHVRGAAHDVDLVLHLIASHHGYCRPFAPVVVDDGPIDVVLPSHASAAFGMIDFGATTSAHELHRLDAPLADRFWRLVERYGWQELCWLEAILRLSDHRASEAEQVSGG